MYTSISLKNCPFCGGEAIFISTSGCSGYIACIGDCNIKTEKYWSSPPEKNESIIDWREKAASIWNRRVDRSER